MAGFQSKAVSVHLKCSSRACIRRSCHVVQPGRHADAKTGCQIIPHHSPQGPRPQSPGMGASCVRDDTFCLVMSEPLPRCRARCSLSGGTPLREGGRAFTLFFAGQNRRFAIDKRHQLWYTEGSCGAVPEEPRPTDPRYQDGPVAWGMLPGDGPVSLEGTGRLGD